MRLKGLVVALMAVMVCMVLMVPRLRADSPVFVSTVSADKPAYYVGETVQVTYKLEWRGVSGNYTFNVQLWNETHALETLGSVQVSQANGTLSRLYSLTDVTKDAGIYTYKIKTVEASTRLTVSEAILKVSVESESITLSIAWDDSSGDRKIDPAETVVFTIYVNWAFVNASKLAVLKVNDGGYVKTIDNVAISQGAGSVSKTYISSFDVNGIHTLQFYLEADNKVIASKAISVQVGQTAERGSWLDVLNAAVENYKNILMFIAVVVLFAILLLVIKKH